MGWSMTRQTVDWQPAILAWEHAYTYGKFEFIAPEAMTNEQVKSQFHYLSNVRKHLDKKPLENAVLLSKIAGCVLIRGERTLTIRRREVMTDLTAMRNEIFNQLSQQKLALDSTLR